MHEENLFQISMKKLSLEAHRTKKTKHWEIKCSSK